MEPTLPITYHTFSRDPGPWTLDPTYAASVRTPKCDDIVSRTRTHTNTPPLPAPATKFPKHPAFWGWSLVALQYSTVYSTLLHLRVTADIEALCHF